MRCPTCREPARKENNKFFPFCGERCHLVDLGRWLNEEYRIPDTETPPPEQGPSGKLDE